LDDLQLAQLDVLRAQISFASDRGSDAPLLMIKAAQRLEPHDASRAREAYLDAITAALFAGRLAHGSDARDVASAALAALRPVGSPRASDLLLDGLARLIVDGPASGTAVLKRALDAFRGQSVATEERLRWSWLAGRAAAFIWDYDSWDTLTARQLEVARDAGALTVLPLTLSTRAGVHMFAGELSVAAWLIEQVEAVADATDTRTARYAAVMMAALHGREHEGRELIDANAKDFASRGEGMGVTLTQWAAALLYNGIARYDDAFIAADAALENPRELWFSPWATVELIEAASRSGRAGAAAPAMERLAEGTSASGTVWAAAIEQRSRALLSEGPVAESLYRDAIDRLAPTALRFDLARTHLVYGEWLRRERRNVDAREQLRAAHEFFVRVGAGGFAGRAYRELTATGEKVRRRVNEARDQLTPQEEQIARLARDGLSNPEIGAMLFLSPRTVEWHLRKVFLKLGITSRTGLRTVLPRGEREPTAA
jgi:Response regulator containing a CheY-like receiver domain and an HTH DNA-binding domain